MKRKPIVAGRFYPDSYNSCVKEIEQFILKTKTSSREDISAGIVPHAGWVFSGQIAFNVIASISKSEDMTFVMLGAVHVPEVYTSAIFDEGEWETPMGNIKVDSALAEEIVTHSKTIEINPDAHKHEHSIEVQLPFIQFLFPEAKIVPIMVPPDQNALKTGKILGHLSAKVKNKKKIIILGSTDLTHYGWNYGFAPFGIGRTGHDWVVKDNDKKIVDLILNGESEKIIDESRKNHNACGAGAITATVSAAKELNKKAELLNYTTSSDVMPEHGDSSFVGYAGIVF